MVGNFDIRSKTNGDRQFYWDNKYLLNEIW